MGLDVYLYRHTDPATIDSAEGGECIEIESARHPQHLFKIGYFRSSYNDSGINRKLRDRLGYDLGDIMGAGDDYIVRPDWAAARDRVVKAIADLRAQVAKAGAFEVMEVTPAGSPGADSREAAMRVFQQEREKWSGLPGGFDSYSNSSGFFDRGGMKVHAVIPGTRRSFFGGRLEPCAYVVYEHVGEGETEPLGWYVQALEIVAETCEWVLAQPNPAEFVLHWSG